MKKVIIIDDENLARSIVREYLQNYPDLEVVAECNNGYEGIKAIQQHHPELIFLDIQMPKINGFEMLELLEHLPAVIFTTAFDEYAIKAFESNAVDYLLKPFNEERFQLAIQKWSSRDQNGSSDNVQNLLSNSQKQADEKNRIVVKNNSEIIIVPIHEVNYIEAYDDYVKVFTKDKYYLKKKTMSYYEQTLDDTLFFRTHRSFIINLQELTRIEPMEKNSYVILLKSGKKIPLSRSAYIKLKIKLGI